MTGLFYVNGGSIVESKNIFADELKMFVNKFVIIRNGVWQY